MFLWFQVVIFADNDSRPSFQSRGGMTVWDRDSLSLGPLRRAADRWHDITGKAGNTMQRSGCPLIWGPLIENLHIMGSLLTHCAIETTHKPGLVVSLFSGGNQRIYTLMCGREIKPFGVVTFIDEWIKIHSRLSLRVHYYISRVQSARLFP